MIRLPLAIDRAHPAFDGHFPSMPIVPGAVLLDHGLRAIAAHRVRAGTSIDGERCRVGSAKFLSFVRPGDLLRLELDASDHAAPSATFRLRIYAGPADDERLALSGQIAYETSAVAAARADVDG